MCCGGGGALCTHQRTADLASAHASSKDHRWRRGRRNLEVADAAFEEFDKRIRGHQVVIVGYSFNDEHINTLLANAVRAGTAYFIVDPQGTDVIDKRDAYAAITQPRSAFVNKMIESIDGASRRDLRSTLASDHIERTKLDHFMTAGDRPKP
jgi:hypothetical protein